MQRAAWPVAGLVSGVVGIAVSHALTMALTLRPNPFVSVGEFAASRAPGWIQDTVTKLLGNRDTGASEVPAAEVLEPLITSLAFIGFAAVCVFVGLLARRSWWQPVLAQAGVGLLGVLALFGNYGFAVVTAVPVVAGVATWIVVLSFVVGPLQRHLAAGPGTDEPLEKVAARARLRRRDFVIRTAVLGLGGAWLWLQGGRFGKRLRHVDETRRLLNLPIRAREPKPAWKVDVPGVEPWRTPNEDFFVQHTAIVPPAVELSEWRLQIHGLVEQPMELTYQELTERGLVSAWSTLTSVLNPVGGDLVGTAWWSGVPVHRLLAEVGVLPGADAVLQTSVDGWTCLTPLEPLVDKQGGAMLAVGMNGEPLPIDHGYPVRTIVPGLYGHVSACKWLTSIEVTRYVDAEGESTRRGFAVEGPVKVTSRIEVPAPGATVDAGMVACAGTAWAPRAGIAAVQVAIDGGPWLDTRLAEVPNNDSWVQWEISVELEPGPHVARVRAITHLGEEQTAVVTDIRPDGATGWHEVEFETA